MELGQRLRQARLDAGLSQRQLCGDTITRNMLSQIENGSARPSMQTLRILAERLGKPMAYFWEEQAVTSPNQEIMTQARQADPRQTLELLQYYKSPDPVFDGERHLLEALSCLTLAERALAEGKSVLAANLLVQTSHAGELTPYYTPELERRRVLLLGQTGTEDDAVLAALLPDNSPELLLRAAGALRQQDLAKAQALLTAVETRDARWHFLQAEVYFAQSRYDLAAEHYTQASESQNVYARLEICYRELKDFEKAYLYACKQR